MRENWLIGQILVSIFHMPNVKKRAVKLRGSDKSINYIRENSAYAELQLRYPAWSDLSVTSEDGNLDASSILQLKHFPRFNGT